MKKNNRLTTYILRLLGLSLLIVGYTLASEVTGILSNDSSATTSSSTSTISGTVVNPATSSGNNTSGGGATGGGVVINPGGSAGGSWSSGGVVNSNPNSPSSPSKPVYYPSTSSTGGGTVLGANTYRPTPRLAQGVQNSSSSVGVSGTVPTSTGNISTTTDPQVVISTTSQPEDTGTTSGFLGLDIGNWLWILLIVLLLLLMVYLYNRENNQRIN